MLSRAYALCSLTRRIRSSSSWTLPRALVADLDFIGACLANLFLVGRGLGLHLQDVALVFRRAKFILSSPAMLQITFLDFFLKSPNIEICLTE